MDAPECTPFPIPTFQDTGDEASPADLFLFLQDFLAGLDRGDPSLTRENSETAWRHLVSGLTENFLATFPSPQELPWDAMHEKLKLTEMSLEVIKCGAERVDSLFAQPDGFAHKVITRLVNLCIALDVWADRPVEKAERYLSPHELQLAAITASISILRSLGGNINVQKTKDGVSSLEALRRILTGSLTSCNDILSLLPVVEFPMRIGLEKTSRAQPADKTDNQEEDPFVTIDNLSCIPAFLSWVVDVCIHTISPPLLAQWYLSDIVRTVVSLARQTLDFLLSASCTASASAKARALSRLGIAMISRLPLLSDIGRCEESVETRLVVHRLQVGPNPSWDVFDAAFEILLGTAPFPDKRAPLHVDIQPILTLLRTENWGEAGDRLRTLGQSHLLVYVSYLEKGSLQMIVDALRVEDKIQTYAVLFETVIKRLASLSSSGVNNNENELFASTSENDWRSLVKLNVQAIIEPDEVAWMDDDDSLSDAQFISRALHEISDRYTRPLYNPASHARELLAAQLGSLPCNLVHANSAECHSANERPSIDTISLFMSVAVPLLDGPEVEVTARVRKAVYDALTKTLRHHTSGFGGGRLEHVGAMIVRAMKDKDRAVRLSAGHSLVELVRLHQMLGSTAWKRTESLFGMIYRLFETCGDRLKETTLIILGHIGRIATGEVLGQDICCLLAQLGQQNPILKGTAYLQLQALSKHYNKTPYNLVSPYMDQVAPFLVSRLCSQPSLLVESCRFFSVSPVDFITVTLSRTLPQLFVNCEARVLEAICKELNERISQLFVNYAHHVLAYVFRLQGPGQTNKVLAFILNLLKGHSQRDIDIASIIRSCVVPLLAELVVVLGNEDLDQADSARQALKKVERVMLSPRTSVQTTPPHSSGAFLRSYMLGVISHLNDMLQDVYGKRSVEAKKTIVRSLGQFVEEIGPAISNVAPQIMATLQTMLVIPQLADVTLESWYAFLNTLETHDLGTHVGPTSASLVAYWPSFSLHGQEVAEKCLDLLVTTRGKDLGHHLDEVVNLEPIPQLARLHQHLMALRKTWSPSDKLRKILERSTSESLTVAVQSLRELKAFMLANDEEFIRTLASGDVFDPMVGQILSTLFSAACRDGEAAESLRLLAFDCIGLLGATDPDRFEIGVNDSRMIVLNNFMDESESVSFALHLIRDLLVGAFRSTSDIKYQTHLAYTIQELLRFCKFTPVLVNSGSANSISLKVRNRWNSLPKHVLETITPLLDSRFSLDPRPPIYVDHPIYPTQKTYREWIQTWTTHLLDRVSGERAEAIFHVFSAVVRYKDVAVAHHLLPHLVLNVLISGYEDDAHDIRTELLAVLEDQIGSETQSTTDKKLLSAQTVFMLMDHLNQWVRVIRQEISNNKAGTRRARSNQLNNDAEEQLLKIDSILSSIDQDLMAKAALQCKAYARSLMNFERQVLTLQARDSARDELQQYYERLHEIYAHLDEPDGMEGVSTLVLSPSLEHQIRQHESTGRWTSAQSCWEVRLQHSPDNPDFHLGLLRCLRNLGHYDTLRTHVKGVLTRNPDWEQLLIDFQVESEWMVGNWDEVRTLVGKTKSHASPILLAQILLALRTGDPPAISETLSEARRLLGAPIVAAGAKGYRRSYNAVLDLHLVHELEVIHNTMRTVSSSLQKAASNQHTFDSLSRRLSARLESTLPTFRTREPILSIRRVAFGLIGTHNQKVKEIIGQSWLASAKIARKAGHWQTAYSAMLQAQQCNASFSFIANVKLLKASGEPLRALQELENCMRLSGMLEEGNQVIDLTKDTEESRLKAKAQVLRARWMNDSDRYDVSNIVKVLGAGADLWPKWESGQFHVGRYHDECYKALSPEDKINRGTRMNLMTVRSYAKAMRYGSKYIYQTVPRLLTLWLDMGENQQTCRGDIFGRVNAEVARAIKSVPVYKWFTAFPQIVSRVGHNNNDVYEILSRLISMVIQEYTKQALWLFTSVVKSTKPQRGHRGRAILDQLRAYNRNDVPKLINESLRMTEELLALCDYPLQNVKLLSMKKDFPSLFRLTPSPLIIPLQEFLTATLPPNSASDSTHQPFPINAPTFARFYDEIEVMKSLARPRKITVQGSNGQIYIFLGKPKDDLRKDARLMDFNAIINKLLKSNSESRRRQLHIRTYGVVTLNEECGFIQWVPNTIPIRPVLLKSYDRRGIPFWYGDMQPIFDKIKLMPNDKEVGPFFTQQILSRYPPVFHEWFIETFPEPTAWLASRLTYSRTAAVMSMIGFILGLGDRHCENILLDTNNGDVVHVDFNCLFEKGKSLETPELVPFRLTQNMVDGFGVTGVEGVFRTACEVTMQLLRDNKDTLMSVLDAFIHDPLVEWEDEKRKKERDRNNRSTVDLRTLAKDALKPIDKKLNGIYTTSRERPEKETSTSSLVQMLIQEASDLANLARMYPGWAPWY